MAGFFICTDKYVTLYSQPNANSEMVSDIVWGNILIDMGKAGDYIPICTRNVFMKYYSCSDTKLHFWSEEDRKDYIYAMNNVLYDHIEKMDKKEIKLIKERIHYGN